MPTLPTAIPSEGVIGIIRGVSPETVPNVAAAIIDGGVTAIEVTADSPAVIESIATLRAELGDTATIGVGTVLDEPTTVAAIRAGAQFVVTPTVTPTVIEASNRYGVPAIPGVYTPTEAQRAYEAGAAAVKLFPASTAGPDHVSALQGPLEQLSVIPTGGITPDNAGEFIAAGATAVGAGSAIVDPTAVAATQYDELTKRATALRNAVTAARD